MSEDFENLLIEVAKRGLDEDLDALRYNESSAVRTAVAKHGRDEDLNLLKYDGDTDVRQAVAEYGRDKDLDFLVHDPGIIVRRAVAEHGRDKDLDILVNDEAWHVRQEVAKHGRDKDLDVLINDENTHVRLAVAKHGRDKDLDVLVSDERWPVRLAVAKHGRDKDLDILVNDEDLFVRQSVARHSRDKDLDILVNDEAWLVRQVVAEQGRDKDLNVLVNDKNMNVAFTAKLMQEQKKSSVEMSQSESQPVFINGIDPQTCIKPHVGKSGQVVAGRVDVDIPFDKSITSFASMYNLLEKQVVSDKFRPDKVSLILDSDREYNVYARTELSGSSQSREKFVLTGAFIEEHAKGGLEQRREYARQQSEQVDATQSIVPDGGFGVSENSADTNFGFDFE